MEVQISPAPQFNGSSDQGIMRVPPAFQPLSKRIKSDLAFQCMVCSEIFDDPTLRYEHMGSQHRDLYGNGFDSDSDDEISEDLSRLLEPICEIKLIDEDDEELPNTNIINHHSSNVPANLSGQVVGEQLGPQIGLHVQMQIQQHLIQSQMNSARHHTQPQSQSQPNQGVQIQTTNDSNQCQPTPLTIRKIRINFLLL